MCVIYSTCHEVCSQIRYPLSDTRVLLVDQLFSEFLIGFVNIC